MTNKTVSIFGGGFIGATTYQAFSKIEGWDVFAYDINPETCKLKQETPDATFVSRREASNCDLVMVCVPTPMNKNTGECYVSIVEQVVEDVRVNRSDNDLVIKSTVPPGTTKRLNAKFGRVFFSPEFLTEANCYDDFVSLPYQIIGSPSEEKCQSLARLYIDGTKQKVLRGGEMILECDATVAEMVKLTRNCYLATRLSFFNEIKQICDKLGISYDDMKELAGLDDRVGRHYNKVPGPGGGHGFSFSCLPKDLNDLMFVAKSLGVDPKVMRGVWEKNLEVRPGRDWENETKAVIDVKK